MRCDLKQSVKLRDRLPHGAAEAAESPDEITQSKELSLSELCGIPSETSDKGHVAPDPCGRAASCCRQTHLSQSR